MKLIAIYTTVGSLQEARQIAKTLVERKLVACAQISEIESFYAWKGEVQNDQDVAADAMLTQAPTTN
jgi:periplasmic divalent cation tolerance protein